VVLMDQEKPLMPSASLNFSRKKATRAVTLGRLADLFFSTLFWRSLEFLGTGKLLKKELGLTLLKMLQLKLGAILEQFTDLCFLLILRSLLF
jgi:hypothetical protein